MAEAQCPQGIRWREKLMINSSSLSILDILVLIELPVGSLDGVWESPTTPA